ncbi:hypothetical protein [Sphaerisporangium dianthi]|uniref:Uncharacterized protein n=1 Tax=Sphaerisporangium dianthi TaxID=1436120 RepID=A0ABV9CQN9_9ACTN
MKCFNEIASRATVYEAYPHALGAPVGDLETVDETVVAQHDVGLEQ